MKKSTAHIGFIALLAVFSLLLSACGKTAELTCPFTAASWDWTKEDVTAAEGEAQETLVSVYGGETYISRCPDIRDTLSHRCMFHLRKRKQAFPALPPRQQ